MVKGKKTKRIKSLNCFFRKLAKERKKHPVYYFFHDLFWEIVRFYEETPRKIKWFIQRGKRGYADCDTWDLHDYLSEVIYKSVHHLKENIHGGPNNLTEGQWIDILNEISYGFKLAKKMAEGEFVLIRDNKERKKVQKFLDEINSKCKSNERCMTYKEIIAYNRGWELFKKYFHNLWD